MFRLAPILAILFLGTAASAQDLPSDQRSAAVGGLRALASADAAQPWTGVGRLDTGVSFCSATLIAERLVLTAAHCLFHPRSGARLAADDLTFQAGLRNGRPEAVRSVRRSVVPASYAPSSDPDLDNIGQDLALLLLDHPVRGNGIRPIGTGHATRQGDDVTVVSYGADREAHASIEEGCVVLERFAAVRLLSCRVVQGSSGAPVLRMGADGPELVAVISATARDRTGRDVSMAASLDGVFADLMGRLTGNASGAETGAASGATRFGPGAGSALSDGGRSGLGARFIRP